MSSPYVPSYIPLMSPPMSTYIASYTYPLLCPLPMSRLYALSYVSSVCPSLCPSLCPLLCHSDVPSYVQLYCFLCFLPISPFISHSLPMFSAYIHCYFPSCVPLMSPLYFHLYPLLCLLLMSPQYVLFYVLSVYPILCSSLCPLICPPISPPVPSIYVTSLCPLPIIPAMSPPVSLLYVLAISPVCAPSYVPPLSPIFSPKSNMSSFMYHPHIFLLSLLLCPLLCQPIMIHSDSPPMSQSEVACSQTSFACAYAPNCKKSHWIILLKFYLYKILPFLNHHPLKFCYKLELIL